MVATATPATQTLPPGWRWVRLGDVVLEAQAGFATSERDPNGTIQLRMNNVTREGSLDWSTFIRVPASSSTISQSMLTPGDVLFNNTNSTELVGKTALFGGHSEPVVYSNHFTRIRSNPDYLSSSFLARWLQAQWSSGVFASICNRWIGQSAVPREKLLDMCLPLPPLDEQHRIAVLLDEQLAAVERARAAAEAQMEAARALPAAYLRAVFESDEARVWPERRIGDCLLAGILIEHQDGNHGELYPRSSAFSNSGVRFVSAKQIRDDCTVALDIAPCLSFEHASRLRIGFAKPNDVLLAHNATVGRVAIAPSRCEPFIVGTSLTVFRPDPVRLLPSFLLLALTADRFQRQLLNTMKQSTRNQVPITKQRQLTIPIPSMSDQTAVAEWLTSCLAQSERLRLLMAQDASYLERLPNALLGQAFSWPRGTA